MFSFADPNGGHLLAKHGEGSKTSGIVDTHPARSCEVRTPTGETMWSKKALVVALAMAASPQADAFSHPNAAVVRLRASGSAVCPAVSRTATLGPQMKGGAANDMGDLTIEMLKRIERNLGELDDMQLAQVSELGGDKTTSLLLPHLHPHATLTSDSPEILTCVFVA